MIYETRHQNNQGSQNRYIYRELARDLTFKFPLYLAVFADWVFMFYLINYICVNQLNYFDVPIINLF
jgi:hypothetical protein